MREEPLVRYITRAASTDATIPAAKIAPSTHAGSSRGPRDERDEQREDQIELLLDRERPEVQHRRRRRRRVRRNSDRRDRSASWRRSRAWRGRRRAGVEVGRCSRSLLRTAARRRAPARRGQEAAGAPGPEARELHPLSLAYLGEQQARDQKAREREEQAHAEVAAAGKAELGVVEQDRGHGEAAQPVERVRVALPPAPRNHEGEPTRPAHSQTRVPLISSPIA